MILNDEYKFAFIHIPKCAGSHIRRQLRQYDDFNGDFEKTCENEELGFVDYQHLPLNVIRSHFPELLEKIKFYSSFAVIRDPLDRFPSSIAQHLKTFHNERLISVDHKKLKYRIDNVIKILTEQGSTLDPEYIHFKRQSDYVYLDNKRMVDHLYLMSQANNVLQDIGDLVGEDLLSLALASRRPELAYRNENEDLAYRNSMIRWTVKRAAPLVRVVLNKEREQRIKMLLRQYRVIYRPRREKIPRVFRSREVRDFIEWYYHDDLRLYQALEN